MNAPTLPFLDTPTLGRARTTDPVTSQEAAKPPRETLKARVEAELKAHPRGLTDWDLTRHLNLLDRHKPSVAKRRQEVGGVAFHDAAGNPVTEPSPDGMECQVWQHPDHASAVDRARQAAVDAARARRSAA